MATNPPITIGELANVPAPGSGVQSSWAQSITRRTVHRFATVAERDAKYPAAGAGTGALCVTTDTGSQWVVVGGAWRAVPLGRVGLATITVGQNGVTTAVDVTGSQVALTPTLGRLYLAQFSLPGFTPGGAMLFGLSLYQGATSRVRLVQGIAANYGVITGMYVFVGDGVATTFKLVVDATVAMNTVPSAANPAYLLIQDIGA